MSRNPSRDNNANNNDDDVDDDNNNNDVDEERDSDALEQKDGPHNLSFFFSPFFPSKHFGGSVPTTYVRACFWAARYTCAT